MAGRYYDDWQVGDVIAHAVTRTVTETDNVLVSALTHNPQPMHLDHEAAAQSEFGRPLVNSIYTFG
jgi:acyl dehydratase